MKPLELPESRSSARAESHLMWLSCELRHVARMKDETPADGLGYLPRSAMSRAISLSLMPTMASPKSSESSAMSFASV